MRRALILDFGGVISRTLFETHPQSEEALGLPPGSLSWHGPFEPESDALWRSMQADEIQEREYWRRRTIEVGDMVGENWTEMSQFVRAARGADPAAVIRPEFHATIAQAKSSGIRLAILSNELDLFYGADFREKLPFMADFEVVIDATYTGILKPDPRAYELCLKELDLPPEDCVFVDDQERNVRGARAVGIPTVHFDVTNPRESYAETRELLGLTRELSS